MKNVLTLIGAALLVMAVLSSGCIQTNGGKETMTKPVAAKVTVTVNTTTGPVTAGLAGGEMTVRAFSWVIPDQDGIVLCSMDGKIVAANQRYLDIIGYTLDEAENLSHQQITPPAWNAMEEDLRLNQVLKQDYCEVYDKEYIRKGGTVIPIRTQAWLIRDDKGEPWRLLGIIRQR